MKLLFFVLMALLNNTIFAQEIKGIVFNENKLPLQGVSVYISNSLKGTTTTDKGNFLLTNLPKGNLTLVFSSIGYETFSKTIDVSNKTNEDIVVYLKLKTTELQEVTLMAYEKDGFLKWGQFFLDNFIGKMDEAADCILKNPEVLRFKKDKSTNTLIVKATKPLQIRNNALGYDITYDLEGFEYNFSNGILIYFGYQFFTEIPTKRKGKIIRWIEKRREVYTGSMMHFMRALYNNKLHEEGFIAKTIIKTKNYEKERVKKVLKTLFFQQNNKLKISLDGFEANNGDSTSYYNKIMNQPNEFAFLVNNTLTADSISTVKDINCRELHFNNHLQVTNKNKYESEKFTQQSFNNNNSTTPKQISSVIELLGSKKVNVFEKGHYFNPTELLSTGWWAWSEKIAFLLPLDYNP